MTATNVVLIASHNLKLGGAALIRPGDSFVPPDRETALHLLREGAALTRVEAIQRARAAIRAADEIPAELAGVAAEAHELEARSTANERGDA